MGKLLESLKEYLNNASKEELEENWKELEPYNEIGPDALEYYEELKKYLKI